MNTTNKSRTKRIRRILVLEEKKLDVATTELKKLQHELHQQQEDLSQLETEFRNTIEELAKTQATLDKLRQAGPWSERAEVTIGQTKTRLEATLAQRDQLLQLVTERRATVKGWSQLIERLEKEDADSQAQSAIIEADDNFLRKRYRKDS